MGFFQIISPLGLPACEIGEASILRRHLRNGIKGFPRLVRHRRGSEGRIGWGCYNFGNSCSGRDRRTKKSTKPDNSPRLLFGNKGLHLAPEAAHRRSSGCAPPAGTRTYTAASDFMTTKSDCRLSAEIRNSRRGDSSCHSSFENSVLTLCQELDLSPIKPDTDSVRISKDDC